MTAQLVYIEDYRPAPVGVAGLYLNAAILAVIPLALFIKGRP